MLHERAQEAAAGDVGRASPGTVLRGMSEQEAVLKTQDLGPGEMRQVNVRGQRLLVANVGQTYYAVSGRCPRDGTDLASVGRLKGHLLICPTDDAVYDLRSGEAVAPPGAAALARYAIKVEQNLVKVGPRLESE